MTSSSSIDISGIGSIAQAVLTGIGIVASGWIAAKVAQLPRLAERTQRLQAIEVMVGSAQRVIEAAENAIQTTGHGQPLHFDIVMFDNAIGALRSVPATDLYPGWLVIDLIEAQHILTTAHVEVQSMMTSCQPRRLTHFFRGATHKLHDIRERFADAAQRAAAAERTWWRP